MKSEHSNEQSAEEYFRSIEGSFQKSLIIRGKKETGFVAGLSIFLFVFSLIPLVPYGMSEVVPRLTGKSTARIFGMTLGLHSLLQWWIACFLGSLILVFVSYKATRPSKELLKEELAPAAMRFAFCYATIDQLRKYQTNRLRRHVESATSYFEDLSDSVARLVLSATGYGYHRLCGSGAFDEVFLDETRAFLPLALRAGDLVGERARFSWFKLEPQTQKILRALSSFPSKLRDRINDKKDLPILVSVLLDLSTYLYSEIPEISDGVGEEANRLAEAGAASLESFAEKVNAMTQYASEVRPETPKESMAKAAFSALARVGSIFRHENELVCFMAWYVLSLVLILSGFILAIHFEPGLRVDTVVISTVVGGPVAGAITAVTIAKLGRTGG